MGAGGWVGRLAGQVAPGWGRVVLVGGLGGGGAQSRMQCSNPVARQHWCQPCPDITAVLASGNEVACVCVTTSPPTSSPCPTACSWSGSPPWARAAVCDRQGWRAAVSWRWPRCQPGGGSGISASRTVASRTSAAPPVRNGGRVMRQSACPVTRGTAALPLPLRRTSCCWSLRRRSVATTCRHPPLASSDLSCGATTVAVLQHDSAMAVCCWLVRYTGEKGRAGPCC